MVQYLVVADANNASVINRINHSVHESWIFHMKNSFNVLYQKREATGKASMDMKFVNRPTEAGCLDLNSERPHQISQWRRMDILLSRSSQTMQEVDPSSAEKEYKGVGSSFAASFIPSIPETVPKLSCLWRFGSRDKVFKPVIFLAI